MEVRSREVAVLVEAVAGVVAVKVALTTGPNVDEEWVISVEVSPATGGAHIGPVLSIEGGDDVFLFFPRGS